MKFRLKGAIINQLLTIINSPFDVIHVKALSRKVTITAHSNDYQVVIDSPATVSESGEAILSGDYSNFKSIFHAFMEDGECPNSLAVSLVANSAPVARLKIGRGFRLELPSAPGSVPAFTNVSTAHHVYTVTVPGMAMPPLMAPLVSVAAFSPPKKKSFASGEATVKLGVTAIGFEMQYTADEFSFDHRLRGLSSISPLLPTTPQALEIPHRHFRALSNLFTSLSHNATGAMYRTVCSIDAPVTVSTSAASTRQAIPPPRPREVWWNQSSRTYTPPTPDPSPSLRYSFKQVMHHRNHSITITMLGTPFTGFSMWNLTSVHGFDRPCQYAITTLSQVMNNMPKVKDSGDATLNIASGSLSFEGVAVEVLKSRVVTPLTLTLGTANITDALRPMVRSLYQAGLGPDSKLSFRADTPDNPLWIEAGIGHGAVSRMLVMPS